MKGRKMREFNPPLLCVHKYEGKLNESQIVKMNAQEWKRQNNAMNPQFGNENDSRGRYIIYMNLP